MKLSRKFVSDYIDIPSSETIKDIAEKMTSIGNEYDSCDKLIPATNLIIGEVVECSMHPKSDHLHVCKINIGSEVLNIICGAPNVREELKVIVALPGAKLPGGEIKKSTILGYESNGMLCSLGEIGIENKFLTEEEKEGIHELPSNAPVGEDPIKYMELDDEVIDFELTSNRGDLLSILGMAYELSSLYNTKVKDIDLSYKENNNDIKNHLSLKVDTDNCSLFLARRVENVTIKESPAFIKNRLIASGIRPINNVVDISNYVMLETGQPLHYYDADRLGNMMGVRMASDNEKLITLDSEERTLSKDDIVIYNNSGAIGLAGVMGGLSTEIEETTKNIIIESAIFNPTLIRKTSKKILRSEASNRFEKGLDPQRTYMAMERSLHLLEKYADASITKGTLEYKNITIQDKEIDITYDKINKVLGTTISKEEILSIFDKLAFITNDHGDYVTVTVPSRRIDISIKEDLIEEVGRIYGLDNIPSKPMTLPLKTANIDRTNREIRRLLAGLGLNETLTYSLINEKEVYKYTNDKFEAVKLLHPMTEERSTLRYSLIPSLLSIYDYNFNRGITDIKLFEIGKGFYKKENIYGEEEKLAILLSGNYYQKLGSNNKITFFTAKGIIERVLNYLGFGGRYYFNKENLPKEMHPGQAANIYVDNQKIGLIGKLHPNITKEDIYIGELNMSLLKTIRVSKMKYKEISKYPGISKDVAFILKNNITAEEVSLSIKKAGGKLLRNITVFDEYKGKGITTGMKSLAFNLYFEDPNKTLTLEEINPIFEKIISEIEKKYKAILRNS